MEEEGGAFGLFRYAGEFHRFSDSVAAGAHNAETVEAIDMGSDVGDVARSA